MRGSFAGRRAGETKPSPDRECFVTKSQMARWKQAAAGAIGRWSLAPALSASSAVRRAASSAQFKIPNIFSPDVREIKPELNEDLLDLFGRAERLCDNRFKILNREERFGQEIPWDSIARDAWAAELHSFDFALTLAETARISREPRYARHLRYLMASWIAGNPPGEGAGWAAPPLARRVRNWIFAADLLRGEFETDGEFTGALRMSLAMQAEELFRKLRRDKNPSTLAACSLSLFLAAACFAPPASERWTLAALKTLRDALTKVAGISEKTVALRPNDLHHLARSSLEFAIFSESHPLTRPTDDAAEAIRRLSELAIEKLAAILLPDATLPLFGPSACLETEAIEDTFAIAAAFFESSRYKKLARQFGIFPYLLLGEANSKKFDGLPAPSAAAPSLYGEPISAIIQIGAGKDSVAAINTNPLSLADGHNDFLTFELVLAGERVIVDSGGFAGDDKMNAHFHAASAHNVVTVDGRASQPSAKFERSLMRKIVTPNPGTDAFGAAAGDFAFMGLGHKRFWYSLGGACWVVADFLEGKPAHRVAGYLHFYPTFTLELRAENATAQRRTLSVSVFPFGTSRARLSAGRGNEPSIPGWYAPEPGILYPAWSLKMEWMMETERWFGGYVIALGREIEFGGMRLNAQARLASMTMGGREYMIPLSF